MAHSIISDKFMNTYLINELTSFITHLEKLINELHLVEENSSLVDIDLTEICGYDRD